MVDFFKASKPIVLIVMDGVGIAPPGPGNAVTLADTPNLDKYWPTAPHGSLLASGKWVGLSDGVDGNSEVGHLTMGIGKVVFQELPRINTQIENGDFFKNKEILAAINNASQKNTKLHVFGLVGDGEVHSALSHLYKLIELFVREKVDPEKVFVHAILDGRDSSPTAGVKTLQNIEQMLLNNHMGRIASFVGRYYAMDRDERWERTKIAYDLLTKGVGAKVNDFASVLERYYKQGLTDEYMTAHVIPDHQGNIAKTEAGDSFIFFNFRPDRALQITRAFLEEGFARFKRDFIPDIYYVGFCDYKDGFPKHVAFPEESVQNTLGLVLSQNRLTQLRIAESEKFPHVTYFFDGGQKIVYPGEDQVEVPSPRDVSTYDKIPEMSVKKIVEVFKKQMDEKLRDFVLINFAPPDMVAHTGVLDAAIKAMEMTDQAVGEIVKYTTDKKGTVLITSDHGNCEELINLRTGEVDTKHSANPVPILIIGKGLASIDLQQGTLADIAPTILSLLGIEKPVEMTGRNLLG